MSSLTFKGFFKSASQQPCSFQDQVATDPVLITTFNELGQDIVLTTNSNSTPITIFTPKTIIARIAGGKPAVIDTNNTAAVTLQFPSGSKSFTPSYNNVNKLFPTTIKKTSLNVPTLAQESGLAVNPLMDTDGDYGFENG
jgi:hypothetical protein